MKYVIQFLTILFMIPAIISAGNSYLDSLFLKANQEYTTGNFANASNLYTQILNQGYMNVDLYYNLGNSYYQLGRLGDAIWAYEKGLQLRPRDRDLKYNLKVVNAKIIDRIEVPEPFFLLDWYRSIKYGLAPFQWLNLISLLILIAGGLFLLSKFLIISLEKIFMKVVVTIVILAIVSLFFFFDLYFEISKKEEAVVVAKEAPAYSAPTDISSLVFVMHEGTKLEITNVQTLWSEVELIDGKKGWVYSELLREL